MRNDLALFLLRRLVEDVAEVHHVVRPVALEGLVGGGDFGHQLRWQGGVEQRVTDPIAGGAQLRSFSPAIMQSAEKAAYELYDELMGKSAHWKRIYPLWKKFRDDQYLWFRVAEYSFDSFAYSQRPGAQK